MKSMPDVENLKEELLGYEKVDLELPAIWPSSSFPFSSGHTGLRMLLSLTLPNQKIFSMSCLLLSEIFDSCVDHRRACSFSARLCGEVSFRLLRAYPVLFLSYRSCNQRQQTVYRIAVSKIGTIHGSHRC